MLPGSQANSTDLMGLLRFQGERESTSFDIYYRILGHPCPRERFGLAGFYQVILLLTRKEYCCPCCPNSFKAHSVLLPPSHHKLFKNSVTLLEAGSTESSTVLCAWGPWAFSTKQAPRALAQDVEAIDSFPPIPISLHQHVLTGKLPALLLQTRRCLASHHEVAQLGLSLCSAAALFFELLRAGMRFQLEHAFAAGEHLTWKCQNSPGRSARARFPMAIC